MRSPWDGTGDAAALARELASAGIADAPLEWVEAARVRFAKLGPLVA